MIRKRTFTGVLDKDLNLVYDKGQQGIDEFLAYYGRPGMCISIQVQEEYPVLGIRRFYRKCILPICANGLSDCFGERYSPNEAHRFLCNEMGVVSTKEFSGPRHQQFNNKVMQWASFYLGVSFPADNEPIESVMKTNEELIRGLRWLSA